LQKYGYVVWVNWDKLGSPMLTQLMYMDYFTHLEFLLPAAWG